MTPFMRQKLSNFFYAVAIMAGAVLVAVILSSVMCGCDPGTWERESPPKIEKCRIVGGFHRPSQTRYAGSYTTFMTIGKAIYPMTHPIYVTDPEVWETRLRGTATRIVFFAHGEAVYHLCEDRFNECVWVKYVKVFRVQKSGEEELETFVRYEVKAVYGEEP